MSLYFISIGTTCLLLVFQLVFEHRKHTGQSGVPAGIFKILTSLGFVVTGVVSHTDASVGGRYLMGGLFLCVAGDALLISFNPKLFRAGLIVFLTAHISYCLLFITMGLNGMHMMIAAPVSAAVGIGTLIWLIPHLKKPMRIPVAAYVIVICTMVTFSVGSFGATGKIIFPIAATIFMASDILVARDRFVTESYTNKLIYHPFYYAAQLLFASSGLLAAS